MFIVQVEVHTEDPDVAEGVLSTIIELFSKTHTVIRARILDKP